MKAYIRNSGLNSYGNGIGIDTETSGGNNTVPSPPWWGWENLGINDLPAGSANAYNEEAQQQIQLTQVQHLTQQTQVQLLIQQIQVQQQTQQTQVQHQIQQTQVQHQIQQIQVQHQIQQIQVQHLIHQI